MRGVKYDGKPEELFSAVLGVASVVAALSFALCQTTQELRQWLNGGSDAERIVEIGEGGVSM